MFKKLIGILFVLFSFSPPFLCSASLPLGSRPYSYEYSSSYVLDEDRGVIHNTVLDRPSFLGLEVFSKNYVGISGSSPFTNFSDFRLSFGCSFDYDDLRVPIVYSNQFRLGSSYYVDSFVDWSTSGFSSYLRQSAYPYPAPFSKFSRIGWSQSSYSSLFDPGVYSTIYSDSILPFGFSTRHQVNYSSGFYSWGYWYNPISDKSFNTNQNSDLYFGNWTASLSAKDSFFNISFDMGDNNSNLSNMLYSSDTINFYEAYVAALSSGMQDFTFGLTLSDTSLENLRHSLVFWWDDDSLIVDRVLPDDIEFELNPDRYYKNPILPLDVSSEFHYGVYYSLIQCDRSGNPLPNSDFGPFLFNTSYDLSSLPDLTSDYLVRLEVYWQDISLSMSNFEVIDGNFWVTDDDIQNDFLPTLRSSGGGVTSFGSNLKFFTWIYNLHGFSFVPTIYANGTGLDDLNKSLSDLNENLSSGFVTTRDFLGGKIDEVNRNLQEIDNDIAESTKSINNMLDYVQKQVTKSIENGFDDLTNGWNDKEAQNLLSDYDSLSGDLDSGVGDIFDILNASLEQSGWHFPSWADFSSLFASFSFVNFGLTSVYTLLGGAVVIGLILSFYFALKALWAIIHRGN